jgi:penicillin amidase
MEALISDVQSKIGREMVPEILAIADHAMTNLTPDAELIVSVLRDWGFECPTGLEGHDPVMSPLSMEEVDESSGCTAWHEALREINSGILRDQPAAGYPSFVTYFSIMDPSQLTAGDVYWDDPAPGDQGVTKYDVIADALDAAAKGLLADYAGDPGATTGVWPWGRKHGFVLKSALAALDPGTFNVYNNPPGDGSVNFWANRGGLSTVDVANSNAEGLQSSGPSTRFQCEATVPVACTIQLPGGQSGHLGNDNYEDLLQLWLDRDPLPLEFDINEAKANAAVTVDYRQ